MSLRLSIDIDLNETELSLLELVARRQGAGEAPVPLAQMDMARSLGSCMGTARRSCQSLERKGLLFMAENRLMSGRQLENHYSVTRLGHEVLDFVDRSPQGSGRRALGQR